MDTKHSDVPQQTTGISVLMISSFVTVGEIVQVEKMNMVAIAYFTMW